MSENKGIVESQNVVIDSMVVKIRVNRRARNVTMRRQVDGLRVTVPYGIEVDRFMEIFRRLVARLPEREVPHYREGVLIDNDLLHIIIERRQDTKQSVNFVKGKDDWMILQIPSDVELTSPLLTKSITRLLVGLGRFVVQTQVIPQAVEVATRVGSFPRGWRSGTGLKTLGTCSTKREITLSAALAFMPPHLREYIICHELAHLKEMNHSERFHQLCDSYCSGREAALERELRAYAWPLVRQ